MHESKRFFLLSKYTNTTLKVFNLNKLYVFTFNLLYIKKNMYKNSVCALYDVNVDLTFFLVIIILYLDCYYESHVE